MKNTFNKSLLALAIVGTSTSALAADITIGSSANTPTTQQLISVEGNVAVVDNLTVSVELAAEYKEDDLLTFTFSGGALDPASAPASLSAEDLGVGESMTLGRVSVDANSIVYRITEVVFAGGDTTIGASVPITGLDFNGPAAIANNGVTVTYSAALAGSGLPLDSTGADVSEQIIFVADEFDASLEAGGDRADSVINVEQQRLKFVNDAADEIDFDTTVVTRPLDTNGDNIVDGTDLAISDNATLTSVNYTVSSDFSWVVDSDAATAGIQPAAGTFALTGCTGAGPTFNTVSVTATELTYACSTGATVTLAIDPRQGGSEFPAALSPKTYSTAVTFAYTDVGTAAQTKATPAFDSGRWTLNGSQVRVPYMVVGNGRFGIIANITNHGSQTGDIVLDVFDEVGNPVASNYAAGTSVPGSIVSVAPALNAALAAAGIDTSAATTKFSFRVTTNVPADDVLVYAAYTDNTTSERAIVMTDAKVQTIVP